MNIKQLAKGAPMWGKLVKGLSEGYRKIVSTSETQSHIAIILHRRSFGLTQISHHLITTFCEKTVLMVSAEYLTINNLKLMLYVRYQSHILPVIVRIYRISVDKYNDIKNIFSEKWRIVFLGINRLFNAGINGGIHIHGDDQYLKYY